MIDPIDSQIKNLETWEDGDGNVMSPRMLDAARGWLEKAERAYKDKHNIEMPEPLVLPCAPNEINLEWSNENREIVLVAGFLLDDDVDYYGEDRMSGTNIHGMMNDGNSVARIIDFLHDHLGSTVEKVIRDNDA